MYLETIGRKLNVSVFLVDGVRTLTRFNRRSPPKAERLLAFYRTTRRPLRSSACTPDSISTGSDNFYSGWQLRVTFAPWRHQRETVSRQGAKAQSKTRLFPIMVSSNRKRL
jgi:hypothetical protein